MDKNASQPPLGPYNRPKPFEDKVYVLTDAKEEKKRAEDKQPRRILLLDDDKELAETLCDFLRDEGCQVNCVSNGVEGMKLLIAQDFDVIICDLLMPNLPGDMFYLAVTKVKPAMASRFIFISGHQANPKWESFIRNAKALVLWKPFPIHDLLTCVEVVMQKTKP
jgi:two-component system, NtrC family, sensor kinase